MSQLKSEGPEVAPARQWKTLAASVGALSLLALAGSPLVLASRAPLPAALPPFPLDVLQPTAPEPAGPVFETPTSEMRGPLSGPWSQLASGAPVEPVEGVAGVRQFQRGGRGGFSGLGGSLPSGPLSAQLALNGPVRGPIWTRDALPNVARVPGAAGAGPRAEIQGAGPRVASSDASSELPDEQRIELTRLANAEPTVRTAAPRAAAAPVSAEKPLKLWLTLLRPPRGFQTGDTVTVHVSSNTDCYAALIRVDSAGHASTVFRSPGASHGFACALKAGPGAGSEYLVALGSIYPLDGVNASAALKASGAGFPAALPVVDGGAAPGAAWSQAVAQASALGGAARNWQRYEWSLDTAAFGARQPLRVAESRPSTTRTSLRRPGDADGSTLPEDPQKPDEKPAVKPDPAPAKPAKEPSVMPTPATVPASAPDKSALPPTTR